MELFGAFKSVNPTRTVHLACLLGRVFGDSYQLQSQPGRGGPLLGGVTWRQQGRRASWRQEDVSLIHPCQPQSEELGAHVCAGVPGRAAAKKKNTVERNVRSALRETLRVTCQQIKFIRSAT